MLRLDSDAGEAGIRGRAREPFAAITNIAPDDPARKGTRGVRARRQQLPGLPGLGVVGSPGRLGGFRGLGDERQSLLGAALG